MNSAEVIHELQNAPRDIRVLCPAGHLIVEMTLSVINGELTTRRRRSQKDLRRRALRGQLDFSGHVHVSDDRNTVLVCPKGHCQYRGYRNEMSLALELAQSALAGHAEHRLTF